MGDSTNQAAGGGGRWRVGGVGLLFSPLGTKGTQVIIASRPRLMFTKLSLQMSAAYVRDIQEEVAVK